MRACVFGGLELKDDDDDATEGEGEEYLQYHSSTVSNRSTVCRM